MERKWTRPSADLLATSFEGQYFSDWMPVGKLERIQRTRHSSVVEPRLKKEARIKQLDMAQQGRLKTTREQGDFHSSVWYPPEKKMVVAS